MCKGLGCSYFGHISESASAHRVYPRGGIVCGHRLPDLLASFSALLFVLPSAGAALTKTKLTLLVPYVCACCGLQDDVGTPQPISPTSVSCPGLTPRICSVWPGWGEGSLNIPFPLFEYAAFSPTYRLRPKPS